MSSYFQNLNYVCGLCMLPQTTTVWLCNKESGSNNNWRKKILLWPYYSKKCHFSLICQIITSVQLYIFWFFSLPLTPGINLSLQNTFLKSLYRSNLSHGSFWNSGGKHHFQLTETVLYNSLDLYIDVSSADISVKPEKTIHVFILIQYNN